MSQVRIVTDSTSDVPPEMAERLQISIVPAYVQIGNHSYRDGVATGGLSREEFYLQLPGMPAMPTTAVPPAHDFAAAYRSLIGKATEVIAIVVSATLSGMYNAARLGAQEVPELNVHIVDSEQVTMGLGWIVIAAAEAAAEGKPAQEIISLVQDMKPRVRVFAMLDTVEYLRRSGRVSWARAAAAQVLRIKPIIEVLQGTVGNKGRTRTRRRAMQQLVELTRALSPLERLAILHTYAPDLNEFRRQLADLCPFEPSPIVPVTTIVGAHVGPRGLGVAVVTT
jgi:DegV family protein with EDD domain